MSYQAATIEVESRFGVTVHNQLIRHESASERLIVMLPGRGYTCNHPVMHYLRKVGLTLGWDVLSVEYGFQTANLPLTPERMPDIWDDVRQATREVLSNYEMVCIAGKSLGTPLAAQLAAQLAGNLERALILLTPIRDAVQMANNVKTLAVAGTADPVYDPDSVIDTANVAWRVFDGLNHSLEVAGDWQASVRALEQVIASCVDFLEEL